MLRTPAPFPEVGSYALVDHRGTRTLARIQARSGDAVLVSLPLVAGAGGTRTIPADQLIDGTPLSDEEAAEKSALDKVVFGGTAPRHGTKKRRQWDRYRELVQRDIYAPLLADAIHLAENEAARRAA